MSVSKIGIHVEFRFAPENENDVQALKNYCVAPESNIYGDATYTDYTIEEDAKQGDNINLLSSKSSIQQERESPG